MSVEKLIEEVIDREFRAALRSKLRESHGLGDCSIEHSQRWARECEDYIVVEVKKLLEAALRSSPSTPGEDAKAARDRLRAFIRETKPGGCRVLSLRDGCTCPLCDVDRLAFFPQGSTPPACEGGCHPFVAYCGARFCDEREWYDHQRICPARPQGSTPQTDEEKKDSGNPRNLAKEGRAEL
jgi:hypothetical protein